MYLWTNLFVLVKSFKMCKWLIMNILHLTTGTKKDPNLFRTHVTMSFHHLNSTKPWRSQIGKLFSPFVCFWQKSAAALQFPVQSCRIPRQSPHLWLIGLFWSTKALIYSPDGLQAQNSCRTAGKGSCSSHSNRRWTAFAEPELGLPLVELPVERQVAQLCGIIFNIWDDIRGIQRLMTFVFFSTVSSPYEGWIRLRGGDSAANLPESHRQMKVYILLLNDWPKH